MQYFLKHLHLSLVVGLIISSLFALHAHAAEIILVGPSMAQHQNQKFAVKVMLDPNGESVNTVALTVAFPDSVKYVSSDDSHSIVQMWVERPALDKAAKTVSFAGIIPGGFAGFIDPFRPSSREKGEVLTLFFESRDSGVRSFTPGDVRILLNDGVGTPAGVVARGVSIVIDDVFADPLSDDSVDTASPLPFTPTILDKQNTFFEGKSVLIFNTKDLDSGIDHYEVKEGVRDYVHAESPYVLIDQTLSGTIFVKAIDTAGNERIEKVLIPQAQNETTQSRQWAGVVVAIIALCVILIRVWLRKARIGTK